jgi:hypothetical protein
MLVLQRQDESTFVVTVCNSGDGLQYHPSRSDAETFPKRKQRTAMHCGSVARRHLLDTATLFLLLRLNVPQVRSVPRAHALQRFAAAYSDASDFFCCPFCCLPAQEGHGPQLFYEAVLPHLLGGIAAAAVVLADPASTAKHGDWDTPQRAGTCYYR